MINWFSVLANSFWIVGLAIILAGLSYYYWLAGQLGQTMGQQFHGYAFQRVALLGLLLVGVGLALTAAGPVQLAPAVALILVCAAALISLSRRRRAGG
jgi:hypothetical protein